jgi:hypothetical protein
MLKHSLKQLTQLKTAVISLPLWLVILAAGTTMHAQQPQIPTLQVCNQTLVQGTGTVTIVPREDAAHTGSFTVQVNLQCNPSGYPAGNLTISGLSMNDSIVEGTVVATTFEQLTTTGSRTPTAYLNGRCSVDGPGTAIQGCRYWVMFANNGGGSTFGPGTPDVVSILIFNGFGQRIAYGTGPVVRGHINVAPTPF